MRWERAIVVSSGLPMTLSRMSVALEAALRLRRALGVDEDDAPSSSALAQKGSKSRVGQLFTGDAAADEAAPQALLLDAVLELLGREVRVLQCDGGKADEALGLGGAELG